MNVPKELSASQFSIDIDFIPDSDEWINFLPRKPPNIDRVIEGANFMSSNPKEDLESSYYRCFNWIHVEVSSFYFKSSFIYKKYEYLDIQ